MSDKYVITSVGIKEEYLQKMSEIKVSLGLPKKRIINQAIKEYLENHDFEAIEF